MTDVRPPTLLLAALLAAGSFGCAEPDLPEQPSADGAEAPDAEPAPSPQREELVAATDDLLRSLTRARDLLHEASEASQVGAARAAAGQALAYLIDGAGRGEVDSAPVFPATTVEERGGGGEVDDALTLTLTSANDAGGTVGREVAEALRDPLAGDLGAWQRDPAGVLATVEQSVRDTDTVEATERAVFELAGEGTRAIAWTLLAAEARSVDDVTQYAERAAAHLEVAQTAIETALGATPVEDDVPDDDVPGDAAAAGAGGTRSWSPAEVAA
ncbi:hypothetical protein [Egicoccus halophilus]|uniref:Uncharacterized protein n=1 Tax=Egicoccus halophilus TaxID=1670830 RepID=A0A8J3A9J0_9ACTN|nr:hypothetical protein [Egicoccus halophilus]GGI07642.1 hypothetical protein GCM10011354_25110 [Egicoccus halophilus]